MLKIPKNNIDDGLGIDEETRLKAYAGASLPLALTAAVVVGIFTPPQDSPSPDAVRAQTDIITNPHRPHEYVVVEDTDTSRAFQIASQINAGVNSSLTGFSEACVRNEDDEILEKHTQDRDGTFDRFGCPKLTTWYCNNNGTVMERTPRDPVVCNLPGNFRRRASR